MSYNDIIAQLTAGIIQHFDEVYHSAEIVTNDAGSKEPAIPLNDEWLSLAPTDQSETIYIRRNGDDEVIEDFKYGSCVKAYKMRSSLRIVYFKDNAKNHSQIIADLMKSVLLQYTKLKSIIRDKWKLMKDESSGDYNFGATTAYFAIDIYAIWDLQPQSCEDDFCLDIQNPLKREACLAVASVS